MYTWLYKKIWDGLNNDDGRSTVVHFINEKGQLFESAKGAIEHLKNLNMEQEAESLRDLHSSMCKVWIRGDETVPVGWMIRRSKEKEFIMSPDGKQYVSRSAAIGDMVKNGCSEEDLKKMSDPLKLRNKEI